MNQIEEAVNQYAAKQGLSFRHAMQFLSTRKTLDTAYRLLDVEITRPEDAELHIRALGSYLQHRGYLVPVRKAPPEATKEECEYDELTRDHYLELRAQSVGRTLIAGEYFGHAQDFYRQLEAWDLKDPDKETACVRQMQVQLGMDPEFQARKKPQKFLLSPSEYDACRAQGLTKREIAAKYKVARQTLDRYLKQWKETETMTETDNLETPCITIHLPMQPVDWPVQFVETGIPRIDRDGLIELGMACLQNAAAWVYKEIHDLLGDDVAMAQVQSFMDRKTECVR